MTRTPRRPSRPTCSPRSSTTTPRASSSPTLDSNNRYAILYRIQEARRPETRARRIAKYVAMLSAGEKIHP